jgi:hypothetical protein
MFTGHQPDNLVFNVPNARERQGERRCMICGEARTEEFFCLHPALCRALQKNVVDFLKNDENPKQFRLIFSIFCVLQH